MWKVQRLSAEGIDLGVLAECEACEWERLYPRASVRQASVWVGKHWTRAHSGGGR